MLELHAHQVLKPFLLDKHSGQREDGPTALRNEIKQNWEGGRRAVHDNTTTNWHGIFHVTVKAESPSVVPAKAMEGPTGAART